MTNLVERLKLIEKAKEDIYFARINRQLIDALHKKPGGNRPRTEDTDQRGDALDVDVRHSERPDDGA